MNGDGSDTAVLCRIARRAFEVVSRILERDRRLAGELLAPESTSRQVFREECITSDVVATLREEFPQHVEIRLFTPAEESRNGADWYWRFERGDLALHARVQAKRVRRRRSGEPDSKGRIEIDREQIDTLVQETSDAARDSLPSLQAWVATYARYDATPPCRLVDLAECSRHSHKSPCPAASPPSLWIAVAHEIAGVCGRGPGRQFFEVKKLIEHSVRLDCVLPCMGGDTTSGPGAKGLISSAGLPSFQESTARIERVPALRRQFEAAMRISVHPS